MEKIIVINDITAAKKVWELLSPNQSVYDDWDYRYFFYQYQKFPIHFLTMYSGDTPIGLLPLEFNTGSNQYEFFAEYFMEDNQLFCRPGAEHPAYQLYQEVPTPYELSCIKENELTKDFPLEADAKYVLPLANYKDFDDYLRQSFSSRRRRHIRTDLDGFEQRFEPTMIWNRKSDLPLLFELNRGRLKAESYFNDSSLHLIDFFRDLSASKFNCQLLSIVVENVTVAVSFAIFFNQTYFYITIGADVDHYPVLGNYVNVCNIKRAFEFKATAYDAGLGDCGKSHWHLQAIPQHVLKKS